MMQFNYNRKNIRRTFILMTAMLSLSINAICRELGEPGKVALQISALQQGRTNFVNTSIFSQAASQQNASVEATIRNYTLISVNHSALTTLLQSKPEFIRVSIPVKNSNAINVLLYRQSISGNGFTLLTSDGRSYNELNTIVHYRGRMENDINSVAAFSFSTGEIMGMVANDHGNFVFGQLSNNNENEYVFYNDRDLIPPFTYECGTNTNNPVRDYQQQQNNNPTTMSVNCVDWYYETDFDIYQDKDSLAGVNNYIQGVFNQVSTLYDNDGISITLQTLFVWTSTDPYTGPSTSNYLTQFGNYRTSFAGDLATLIGYAGGGGIAWLDQLCNSNISHKMGYAGISANYSTVPTYSWTVEVVTHEDGHLLGSSHTHDCVWNGNSTAIDGCGDAAGYNGSGSCATASLPSSGTIMSYCHLVSGVGINFNNGFGSQPTARILTEVNNANCLSACTTCQTPSQPGSITGATTYCGSTSQTYSITAVGGATSYTWTKPSGWTGTSTTNSITVTTSGNGGTLSVTADNACGNSPARTLTVTGNTAPSQPGNISGSSSVCQGSTQVYSVSAVNGATSYVWTKPSGWTGTSTTNNITLVAGSSGGSVTVAASNSCGTSNIRSMSVSVSALPAQPGTITGNATICAGSSQTYSIGSVSGATSYTWTLPAGWTGSSTTTSITITAGASGGTISVAANNSCGSGTTRTLSVSTNPLPAQPGSITGNATICAGSAQTYSIGSVAGATSYTWTLPAGWTGNSTTTSISVTAGASGGTISVVANNSCGSGTARTLSITTNALPAQPGTISGNATICGASAQTYSISAVSGATSYTWTLPVGWTGSSTTTSISVTTGPSGGTISVVANNSCGSGIARTLSVTTNSAPAQPGSISGNTSVCVNTSYVYTVSQVPGASSYTWTLPLGWSGNSTTNSITVISGVAGGTISVIANNSCGSSIARTASITIAAAPTVPGTITAAGGNTKVCPGDSKTYSISAVSGATSYIWTPPPGSTITNGQGTVSVTVLYQAGFVASDSIKVQASNGCAISAVRFLKITRNNPAKPSAITGSAYNVCNGNALPYNVTNVAGMNYNWTFNTGSATVNGGQGTNAITASYTPNFVSGVMSVTAGNACGISAARTLTIYSKPAQPGVISGTTTPCSGQQGVPYSIVPLSGISSYFWTAPAGATINDGSVTSAGNTLTTSATSVTINFGATAGYVRVRAINACASGTNRSMLVSFGCRVGDISGTEADNLNVYPNPANDVVHVQFESETVTSHTLRIIDLSGKVYHLQSGISAEGTNETDLNVESLAPGIYFLEVLNGEKKQILKISIE